MSADRLAALLHPHSVPTLLADGFGFTEGPVWIPARQCLLFSDMFGDSRWRWSAAAGLELVASPNFKGNGMCLDRDGDLLVCEQVSSCLVRIRGAEREILAFHYGGKYLNSPNDVVVRGADGSIYFTDPPYGRIYGAGGWVRSRDLTFAGVFRVPTDGGEVELVVEENEFAGPNGLCFSPDESVLYVNDSDRHLIKAFDVAADGSLGEARVLIDGVGGGPDEAILDGMECDELGNIWVTGPGGVWVISAQGEQIGVIETPETCTSLTWGGADMHTLFLTTMTSVHTLSTLVGPSPLPPLR
ncbi:MAG TPA: SMP-30/gluconolactonase/LRE family protein [Solirubrobacteraceae bacterium]